MLPKQAMPTAVWRAIAEAEATVLVGFPFLYDLLVKAGGAPTRSTLRLCISSAAPLQAETAGEGFRERTGLGICDYYGIVEAGPCTYNDQSCPGSVGRALANVSLRLGRVGAEGGIEPTGGGRGGVCCRCAPPRWPVAITATTMRSGSA